jgi:hypothetical protein
MLYDVEEYAITKVERVMKILYSEKHLNGNNMRDMAQELDAAIRIIREGLLTEIPITKRNEK